MGGDQATLLFDVATTEDGGGSFRQLDMLPAQRYSHCAVAVDADTMVVIGGVVFVDGKPDYSTVQAYSKSTE